MTARPAQLASVLHELHTATDKGRSLEVLEQGLSSDEHKVPIALAMVKMARLDVQTIGATSDKN